MNIVDSSCWLEYFAGSKIGDEVSEVIEDIENLVVPSITIFEVVKKLILELDEDRALFAAAHMKQGKVIDVDSDLAIFAAKLSRENTLAMADSLIYATAKKYNARLYSTDKHFKDLDNVMYYKK